jgi:hypothetical protein
MRINLEKLKYPIGSFVAPEAFDERNNNKWINTIAKFPQSMYDLTAALTIEELNYPYRLQGWMIKQVVHHCADSHMNAFIRFKQALTEDRPTIRPYFEDRWARLPDGLDDDISISLNLLRSLHQKLVQVFRHMTEEQWMRSLIHPATGVEWVLYQFLAQYAWHSDHHLAHIRQALKFKGQFDVM